ncbi:Nip100p NDAI_0K01100 [Naumovozyma dairenensis CBS 421]|uniref:CAP-Gly domain-containing protein n=1 Tax=Naumovozyma dairenensis (strain ATCC 10597 / BCRC 20456 / CBS 421 / NBRC 0211 / NRRL Y-12639) TaxID=1071378 RepID=G0WHP0_NAUDC|nr:hypothetical protein NDAI_0K01100 [Naumovozyma dairenensis CBS 421]CCD27301.1 hypothetical protein NDAI_0K01100 [Naumovozyma dairenensis CBS 421]
MVRVPKNSSDFAGKKTARYGTKSKSMDDRIRVNDRVQIGPENNNIHGDYTGIVKYIGPTDFATGIWCGIHMDNPKYGKNDGSIDGIRYFQLASDYPPKAGLFTRIENVQLLTGEPHDEDELTKLREIVQALQNKVVVLKKELKKSFGEKMQLKGLQDTIELLTLNDEDLNLRNQEFLAKIQVLQEENKQLLNELQPLREELEMRRSIKFENTQKNEDKNYQSLLEQNKLLQNVLNELEKSLTESLQDYELVLEENTKLISKNSCLQKSVEQLTKELESSKTILNDLKRQLMAEKDSTNIVDFLTEQNNELLSQVNSLTHEIEKLSSKENTTLDDHLNSESKLQQQLDTLQNLLESKEERIHQLENVIKEIDVEGRDQEQKHLKMQLTKLRIKISDLEQELFKDTILIKFHEITTVNKEDNLALLPNKLQYFLAHINDKELRDSIHQKKRIQCMLILLKELTSVKETFQDDLFREYVVHVSDICHRYLSEFAEGFVRDDTIDIETAIKFLNSSSSVDKDPLLLLNIYREIFECISFDYLDSTLNSTNSEEIHAKLLRISELCKEVSLKANSLLASIDKLSEYKFSDNNTDNHECIREIFDIFVFPFTTPYSHIDFGLVITVLNKIINRLEDNEFIINLGIHTDPATVHKQLDMQNKVSKDKRFEITGDTELKSILEEKVKEKDAYIQELTLRLQLIDVKNTRNLERENLIGQLKNQISTINDEKIKYMESIRDLKRKLTNTTKALKYEKLNQYQLIISNQLNEEIVDRETLSRVDLISEINDLRKALSYKCNTAAYSESVTFEWLNEDMEEYIFSKSASVKTSGMSEKLHALNKTMNTLINESDIRPANIYDENVQEIVKYKMNIKHSISNIKFKDKLLDHMITELNIE